MKTSGIKHNLSVLLKMLLSTAIFLSSAGQAEQYESPYKKAYRYSKTGLMLGSIQPDADGDSLNFPAQRFTYHPTRPTLVITIESGNLEDWLDETIEPAQWTDYTDFTIFTTQGFEYDDYGRKIKEWVKGANGNIERLTQYTYNAKGLVKCKTQRMNQAAYNALPADACVQSAAGTAGPDRITRYTYNNLDLVLTEERAVGTPLAQTYVTNTYDGYLVKTQTDANGNKTTLEYDEFDRLEYRYYPSKTVTGASSTTDYNQYGYDLNNNLKTERKRNGSTITYTYDNNNRLIKKDLSNNTWSGDVFYNYDLRGLTLHSRFGSDSGQGVINTFDGFGNLLQATTTMGGTSRTLSYRYDHNSNRTRITHPDGKYFGYTFDGLDRVTGLAEETTAMLSLNYWGHGKRHTITRGNSTTTYTFDNILRLESLAQNLAGTANDLVNSFTYIPSNQIHTLTVSNNLFRYAENANRTGQYAVNGLNQYTSVAGGTISYDANGNLTQHSGTTYTYDDENRLTSVSGTTTASFKYDPLGRLFETTIGGVKTQYLYDGDALVAEYNSAGTLTRRYVHGDQVDEPWVQYNSNLIGSAHRRFLHADHQGSIIAHSDSSGNKTAINTYDAFGIPGGNNIDRFGYTGQIWLPELGLYHYKARMYEPRLGRFLQTDPVGYEDQMNLYAYVHNDPVNMVDPTGEFAFLLVPILVNVTINVAAEVITQKVQGKSVTTSGMVKAVGAGVIGGVVGGSTTAVRALKAGGDISKMMKAGKAIDSTHGINKNALTKSALADYAQQGLATATAAVGAGQLEGALDTSGQSTTINSGGKELSDTNNSAGVDSSSDAAKDRNMNSGTVKICSGMGAQKGGC